MAVERAIALVAALAFASVILSAIGIFAGGH